MYGLMRFNTFLFEGQTTYTARLIYIWKGLTNIVVGFILHYCNLVRPAATLPTRGC